MDYRAIGNTILLFATAVAVAYLFFEQAYLWLLLLIPILIYLLISHYKKQIWIQKQFMEFAESVKYRDFTRRYSSLRKNKHEKEVYSSFNLINDIFREISSEKEFQHQYLSEIFNMLDAAILLYHAKTGKVELINEAFKNQFDIPHLGSITGIEKRNPDLFQIIENAPIGTQQLDTAFSSKGKIKLLIQVSEFESQDTAYRIFVFQNINKAVDETENQAWHKLLRVLTHEIMNSIAPISSLAETLNERLQEVEETSTLKDVKTGIATIKNRSEGLLKFAKSYRLINKVDTPNFEAIAVVDLFEGVYQLLEPNLVQKGIEFDLILKNIRLKIQADKYLMEQVLINLILNAIEALEHIAHPKIQLIAKELENEIHLSIRDNGQGMEPEFLEQIFTPFFTTKKSGNGIGLTLSKQIMLVHGGSISAHSELNVGSEIVLKFGRKQMI